MKDTLIIKNRGDHDIARGMGYLGGWHRGCEKNGGTGDFSRSGARLACAGFARVKAAS
jgi:hypothetical protein